MLCNIVVECRIWCVRSFLISVGEISADMIVINDMAIETYPAQDDGTPKSFCITGQPEPRSESGNPRLTNARYMTANSNEPMLYASRLFHSDKAVILSLDRCFDNIDRYVAA